MTKRQNFFFKSTIAAIGLALVIGSIAWTIWVISPIAAKLAFTFMAGMTLLFIGIHNGDCDDEILLRL